MRVIIVIAVIAAIIILVKLLSRSRIDNSASWFQFYTKGTDSGFTFKEIELLRRLADKSSLEDPTALFWSVEQLDNCIRNLVHEHHVSGKTSDSESQDFLAKLYAYRKKIEMDKPGGKGGLSNTRQLNEGQNIRLQLEGYGVFKSQIIRNVSQHIIVSKPNSAKMPGIFSWSGQRISVYFWRDQDAGYVFDTEVTDEIMTQSIACLKLTHSDNLSRTQKRRSIRVRLRKTAYLYHLVNEEDANKLEVSAGLKCLMEDLSDTGCAITVAGKAEPGLRIKAQFTLSTIPVVMPGTVRSIEFKEDKNQSLLHIEADPLPIDVRNQIMGEVFGLLPENEDDLPFRILDEDLGGGPAPGPQPKVPDAEIAISALEG